MTEPVMCCGGTCVRAVCEYHKDEPLSEVSPETLPSALAQPLARAVDADGRFLAYYAGRGWVYL